MPKKYNRHDCAIGIRTVGTQEKLGEDKRKNKGPIRQQLLNLEEKIGFRI